MEIMAILNNSAQNKEHAGKSGLLLWCIDECSYATDASSMCVQTIFTVIDHLTTWADSKAKAAAVRRVKGVAQRGKQCRDCNCTTCLCLLYYEGNPEEIKLVTSFLEGIPKVYVCVHVL